MLNTVRCDNFFINLICDGHSKDEIKDLIIKNLVFLYNQSNSCSDIYIEYFLSILNDIETKNHYPKVIDSFFGFSQIRPEDFTQAPNESATFDQTKKEIKLLDNKDVKVYQDKPDCKEKPSLIKAYKNIITKITDTFEKKNNDYGNSYENLLDKEGLATARVLLGIKMDRFNELSKNLDKKKVNESLSDTLEDMANYAIMTAAYLEMTKE